MSDPLSPEQVLQSILQNVQVGGNLTIGDINQILNLLVIVKQPDSFKPTGIPHNLPRSGTIKFVGRAEALENLHQMVQHNNQVVIAAIEGMGGVGKTELATQYALLHLLLLTYPGGICWLRARDEDIGIQVIRFAQTELGLKPPEDLDLPEQVHWCWRRWHERDVLVVLDDVCDYLEVSPYLPPQPSRFKVLITTRLQLLDLPQSLTLDVLGEVAALELLREWVGSEKIDQQLADAKKLCHRLGYLPLALNLVGRYVKKRKISLAELLQRLEKKGLQHKALDVDKNDRTWTLNVNRGVATAFELSWEELSDQANQLGCLLSLFALAPIPWSMVKSIETGQDSEDLEDARVELESLHLLQGDNTYRLHQLIREFFREKLEQSEQVDNLKRSIAAAMVLMAKEISQPTTYDLILAVTPAIPHLVEVANHFTTYLSDNDLITPFNRLAWFYEGQGFYEQAEPWLKQCLATTQVRFGFKHPHVASSLNELAELYHLQGRYSKAEELYLQALELRQSLFGAEHADVATCLNNLGELYKLQGRYSEAEELHLQALEQRQSLLGSEHTRVAESFNNLATLYNIQSRYSEAEPLLMQALAIWKGLLGEEHPRVATCLNNLAYSYSGQGRYSEAERLYERTLILKKHLLGEDHPGVAISLKNLAKLYESQGCYREAQTSYVEALVIFEQRLGFAHPNTVIVRENLTNFLKQALCEGRADLASLPNNPSVRAVLAEVQASLEQSE